MDPKLARLKFAKATFHMQVMVAWMGVVVGLVFFVLFIPAEKMPKHFWGPHAHADESEGGPPSSHEKTLEDQSLAHALKTLPVQVGHSYSIQVGDSMGVSLCLRPTDQISMNMTRKKK